MGRRLSAQNGHGVPTGVPVALIYTRVSSEDQATEGTSLAAQLAVCRRYCVDRGFVIDSEWQDVMSGKRDDRPAYQQLLDRVRELHAERRMVAVVVAALDRFSRRMLESVRCREELTALGVSVHGIREGGVVDDFIAHIYMATAQQEVRRLSMRVKTVWAELTENGYFKCSKWQPWGYVSRPTSADERAAGSPQTVLDRDPIAAPSVREVFERIASGESTRRVAVWAASLPPEVRGPWLGGEREITRRTLQTLLRNPVYAALRYDKNEHLQPTRWPAIVDAETWHAVQQRLDRTRDAPRAQPTRYPLTGLLHCQACGQRMQGLQARGVRRYRCGSWGRGGSETACTQSADAAQVEALVLAEAGAALEGIVSDGRVRDGLKRAWAARQATDGDDTAKQTQRLAAQVERSRQRIKRGTELLVDGTIERQAYDDLVAQARADEKSAESELATVRRDSVHAGPKLLPLEQVLASVGGWRAALAAADVMAQRDVLALLVERVVPQRLKRGTYSVDVTWTALGSALSEMPK